MSNEPLSNEALSQMTKPQLQELCRTYNIKGFSTLNKARLIELIQQHTRVIPSSVSERTVEVEEEKEPEETSVREESLRTRIQALYNELQQYSEQEQMALLRPYFTLLRAQDQIEEKVQSSSPIDLDVKEDEKEDDEIFHIPYEERVRTITSDAYRTPIEITDPEDIANVLNTIEDTNEDVFKQIPMIRRNIQKCLGLV